MTKERINEYSLRISQANRTQLVVIIYDIILEYLDDAEAELKNNNTEGFVFNIKKAKQFINQLSSSLDFSHKISFELMNLYMFANQCLIESEVKRQNKNLDSVKNMMVKLKYAFEGVCKIDDSKPLIKKSQIVYEGLTYSKDARHNVNISGRNY